MLVKHETSVAAEIDELIDPNEWQPDPTPRAKRKSPERQAQQAVVKYLRRVLPAGSVVAAITNEQKGAAPTAAGRARFGIARKASGVVTGMPDLLVLVPGGKALFIEMKAPRTGRLSDAQREMHDQLRALGFGVAVATCIDTAREALRGMGVELRA